MSCAAESIASSRFCIAASRPTGVPGVATAQTSAQLRHRLRDRVVQARECGFLRPRRLHDRLDAVDRQIRKSGLAAPAVRGRALLALQIRSDLVEARLLLVGERLVERRQRRADDPDCRKSSRRAAVSSLRAGPAASAARRWGRPRGIARRRRRRPSSSPRIALSGR